MTAATPSWRMLQFTAARFGPAMFRLAQAVPYLDHVLCWMDETHFQEENHAVRRLHAEMARHGYFELRLPGTGVVLRSARAVMLEHKAVFFGVQGRTDLVLAASRVGFGQPLTAVLLPEQRLVINVHGEHWNIDAAQAERAMSLFGEGGLDSDPAGPPPLRVAITGDVNYAHHMWNQLGALDEILQHVETLDVAATHQPIAPIEEIFAGHPGLRVRRIASRQLPLLDPRRVLPFPLGGNRVVANVRTSILRIAAARATPAALDFIAATAGLRRVWLTVRVHNRTARNLMDALAAIGAALLNDGGFALVLDGFAYPNDYAANPDYDQLMVVRTVTQERKFAEALCHELGRRAGARLLPRVHIAVGGDLLESIHLLSQCHAYFAHHGTLQHRAGYFTQCPGMAHANPGILASDPAGSHRYVTDDPAAVDYVDASLVESVAEPGAAPTLNHSDNYRFTDVPRLVETFRAFVERHAPAGGETKNDRA